MDLWFEFICTLRAHNIWPIFVYDGHTHDIKRNTLSTRANRLKSRHRYIESITRALNEYTNLSEISMESTHTLTEICGGRPINPTVIHDQIWQLKKHVIHVSTIDIQLSIELLQHCGLPYIIAPGESDKLCVVLYQQHLVDYILSDDSDFIAYGCPTLRNYKFFPPFTVIEYIPNVLTSQMKLSYESFFDFCMLCGTDYHSIPVANWSASIAYDLIQKWKTIERAICKCKVYDSGNILPCKSCRKLVASKEWIAQILQTRAFMIDFSKEYEYIKPLNLTPQYPNYDKIVTFLELNGHYRLDHAELVNIQMIFGGAHYDMSES